MNRQSFQPCRESRPAGFTLVEILAVITIIAVLLSVAAVGIQRIDRGQATTTALALAEAVFEEARSVAVSRGTRARVVIHNNFNDADISDRENYRAFLFVSALDENDRWEVVTRGTKLPAGVYFDPDLSSAAANLVGNLGTWGADSMAMPGSLRTNKEGFYFEFNSEGICKDGELTGPHPGAAFVVIGGVRPQNQGDPIMQGNNKEGFIIWRNGRTSLFRSPEQIQNGP